MILFLWSLLGSCDSQRLLLNSERIQQKYGSFGIDVLTSSDALRVSNLFSEAGGERICRTYAIVDFVQPVDPAVLRLHETVSAGASIGATFKRAGWEIRKSQTRIATLGVSNSGSAIAELMRLRAPFELAMHSYDFSVARAGREIPYASIIELHHPDYLDVAALEAAYGHAVAAIPQRQRRRIQALIEPGPIVTQ